MTVTWADTPDNPDLTPEAPWGLYGLLDDTEPRWMRRLMLGVLLGFTAYVAVQVAVWALR